MKQLIILAIVITYVTAMTPGLIVRFGLLSTECFYSVPQTQTAAEEDGWTVVDRGDEKLSSLVTLCPYDLNNLVLCGNYDDNGYIAGLHIAIPQENVTDTVYDWAVQGYTEWVVTLSTGVNKTYWAKNIFFISEDDLATSAATRVANRNDDTFLQFGGVWVEGFNGDLVFIGNNTDDIVAGGFTKQSWIIWMGTHYYYNMSSDLTCAADTIFPWFPLVQSDELIGIGFFLVGQLPEASGIRDYFERPSQSEVKKIVPDGASCFYELASDPGIVTMHIYFVKHPRLILTSW